MKHYMVWISLCVLSCFSISLSAQSLTTADLLKIYNLDSIGARQYCASKQFLLINADNTGANKRYQYQTPDSSYRLEIRYPNDSTSVNVQLSYWFTGAKEYKTIKTGLRKAGFNQQKTKQTGSALPANASRYIANALQVELIRPQGIQKSYWLFLHPTGSYSW